MDLIPITQNHFPEVARIYQEGIATGLATFETTVPSWEDWDRSHLNFGRLCIEHDYEVLGWAALSPVSSRCVYGGVAEVSVYISAKARGKGLGMTLLNALIEASEINGIWTLQSGIFPDNKPSIALHEKCGFRMIGYRERIGQLHGKWHDNVIMERRSKTVGN